MEHSPRLVPEIRGLENPYLDELRRTQSFPGSWEDRREISELFFDHRGALVRWYSWAIPDEEALGIVGKTGSVVEIGAGGGYWAALLRARGVEVHAYDPHPGKTVWSEHLWTDVSVGKTRPVENHPGSTLFLCWPSYTSRFAEVAARRYLRAGGRRIVYVGEEEGGCCADDGFFDLVSHLVEVERHPIMSFAGIHDNLIVWEIPSEKGGDSNSELVS